MRIRETLRPVLILFGTLCLLCPEVRSEIDRRDPNQDWLPKEPLKTKSKSDHFIADEWRGGEARGYEKQAFLRKHSQVDAAKTGALATGSDWDFWTSLRTNYESTADHARYYFLKRILPNVPLDSTPPLGIREDGGKLIEPPGSGFTHAEVARIRLRLNLKHYKSDVVKKLTEMLEKHPPEPTVDYETQKQAVQDVANAYLKAVDQFLKTHPGARPKLGSRNALADAAGWQDEFNAPWCADWAKGMVDAMHPFGAGSPAIRTFRFNWAQMHQSTLVGNYQHNFLAIYPVGNRPETPLTSGTNALMMDPWIDISPRAYFPRTGYSITNFGIDTKR